MRTTDPARIEDVHDPIGKLGWPIEKGRDGERTPMQWDGTADAGFSTAAKPWLAIPPSAGEYNVERERREPNSIFNAYKTLLSLRREDRALRDGSYQAVNLNDPNVFAFLRRTADETVLVALNMSSSEQVASYQPAGGGGKASTLEPLYSSAAVPGHMALGHVVLAPFAALVARIH